MKRIFPDYTYGPGPRQSCWWDETIAAPDWPRLQSNRSADVAIIGGGFTGVSAALHLAEAGADVTLLEAASPGWGASGRNGGFCCLGGARLGYDAMARLYGEADAQDYERAEIAAVELVADLLKRHRIKADVHSRGETQMAHRARDMGDLRRSAEQYAKRHDLECEVIERADLAGVGMNGPFFGALTVPVGFGLNPRKYLFGLAQAARSAGADLYQDSAAIAIDQERSGVIVRTAQGAVSAKRVLIATNGYSSEDLPDWLAGRYMPSQSNVLVTRVLSDDEIAAQGWHSDQMAYDTRNLLHYFRLMPDRRFLFGMRGGLRSSPGAERQSRARTRRHFERMFPAWRDVSSEHSWSGLVCVSRRQVPFVGPVPGFSRVFAGMAYHGNGVAMGSYAGKLLADLALGCKSGSPYPRLMAEPMTRFPIGTLRRLVMPPAYALFALRDL